MRRMLLGMLALAAFGSPAAIADGKRYKDPEARFSLTVPTGWDTARPENEEFALVMASPKADDKTPSGVCLVRVRELSQTKDVPQADLDEAFGTLLTREFWGKALAAAGATEVKIENTGTTILNGRKTYFVVATLNVTAETGPMQATGKQVVYVIPGSVQFVNCSAKKDFYAAMSPQFEGVFASFEPKSGAYIAEAEQVKPSLLTVFAGPEFDGVARVIAQNTANIPALAGVAGSVVVAGAGAWEVCDGVNYSGKCQVLAADSPAGQAKLMQIGSVRRAPGVAEAREIAGAISAGAAQTVKAVTARVIHGQ